VAFDNKRGLSSDTLLNERHKMSHVFSMLLDEPFWQSIDD
jgi:hypothetical protein